MPIIADTSGVTLADLKVHLDIEVTNNRHDAELTDKFLPAAEAMVRDWSSEVTAASGPELVTVTGGQVLLSRYPATAVTAVEVVNAYSGIGTLQTDLAPYWLANPAAGIVRAPWRDGTWLRVTYTAGENVPSAQFRLAVLETAAFLWRGRKGGSESYLPAGEPDVSGPPLLGGLKRRVLLILGDRVRGPVVA